MSIRHVAAAAMFVCAGVAHADPIASTTASGGFLNNWTTGNGTDVLASGVLGSGMTLVGGVSHSSAGLDGALLDKSSSNMTEVNGQTQLVLSRGIEGSYLLAQGNGILAATLGAGKSVIGSANGAVIIDGSVGGAVGGGGGLDAGGGFGGGAGGGAGAGGGNGGAPSGSTGDSAGTPPGNTSGGSTGNAGNATEPLIPAPSGNGNGSGNGSIGGNVGGGGLQGPSAVDPAAVPEPSSIALMLAGMMGAGALSRRRSRK